MVEVAGRVKFNVWLPASADPWRLAFMPDGRVLAVNETQRPIEIMPDGRLLDPWRDTRDDE